MNSFTAFLMGQANRHCEMMVFDWEKAASIIKERGAKHAGAGLSGDWECTGGEIFTDGKPVAQEDTYTFLASTWATPVLCVDGEMIDCFRMASKSPGWGSDTYWPKEALDILAIEC